jgi:hypothetical protein
VPHCTPEQLALAALGERLPDDDAAHLASCESCRAEVRSLRRGVEALAIPEFAVPAGGAAPPPSVWSAIAEATGVAAAPRPDVRATAASAPPRPVGPAPAPALATVMPLRRRRARMLLAVAAALVGAVVGAGTVVLVQRDDGGTQVAATALDPLSGHSGSGRAEVVERNGQRVLEVRLSAPALRDGYYEVWLAERTLKGMVPLGVAQPGTLAFEIPNGLDLAQYPVVDVSIEPLDGDPGHSSDSLLRGTLRS